MKPEWTRHHAPSAFFKLRLSFLSLVSLSALIGLCSAILAIPLLLAKVLFEGSGGGIALLLSIAGPPFSGLLNGALFGVLAYPLYAWVTRRVGFKYKGAVYVLDQ